MFSSRASQSQLATFSRNLSVSLFSGVPIVKAFQLASAKARGSLRTAMLDVVTQLKSGSDVTTALRDHDSVFPALFIDTVGVGESTGSLPEVLRALALHYENNVRLRREFLEQITYPAIQLVAAISIIALLIWILGWLQSINGGESIDILNWGLIGTQGVMIWLGGWALAAATLVIGYQILSRSLTGRRTVHAFLLQIPVIGSCLRNFAVARFAWAFHLTQESGMRIQESLEASLKATSNGAFIAAGPAMEEAVMQGASLTDAWEQSGLFPREFIEVVHVAETSGTVPEQLERLSPQFEENARRSLSMLATTVSWVIWGAVATFVIFMIFKFALFYIGLINSAADMSNML